MPVKPDSRFANLPILEVVAPDGSIRRVIALRLKRAELGPEIAHHQVLAGEEVDLLARYYFGDEGLWWQLLDANAEVFPLDIEPGAVLSIPSPGPATRVIRARKF
jgi:hypothetical protein